jgi:hypothetical protein
MVPIAHDTIRALRSIQPRRLPRGYRCGGAWATPLCSCSPADLQAATPGVGEAGRGGARGVPGGGAGRGSGGGRHSGRGGRGRGQAGLRAPARQRMLMLGASLLMPLFLLALSRPQAVPDPAAVFLTWSGDPTTTVTVDWHLLPGAEQRIIEFGRMDRAIAAYDLDRFLASERDRRAHGEGRWVRDSGSVEDAVACGGSAGGEMVPWHGPGPSA